MEDRTNEDLERVPSRLLSAASERQGPDPGLFKILVTSIKEYAVFMLDADGHILTWNEGAERIKKYRADEVLGQHFRMLYVPEDRTAGRPEKNLHDAREHGQTEDLGWRMKKDGTCFWADAVIAAIQGPDGNLLGFAKVMRDLTEINKSQQHARHLEVLKHTVRLKDEFLSLISHELRTPLTSIKGLTSLVEDESLGPLTAEQHQYLKQALQSTDALNALISDLLDLNQLQAGRFRIETSTVNFAEIVEGAVYAIQPLAEQKSLWLQNHVSPDLPDLRADAHRIGQVLIHLLDNAIKFTSNRGRIEIRARTEGTSLLCEIQDTGQGVSAKDFEDLFQSFTQLDMSSTRRQGGLGIGLRLSKMLVEAHGGTIGLRSEGLGQGVTVWFTLPLPPPTPEPETTSGGNPPASR